MISVGWQTDRAGKPNFLITRGARLRIDRAERWKTVQSPLWDAVK
jgi:hypothetical protein